MPTYGPGLQFKFNSSADMRRLTCDLIVTTSRLSNDGRTPIDSGTE